VSNQRGAALIVVLVLLLAMTMLGLASLRGTIMEERMSANMYDRSLAFQAAEAALREAESALMVPGVRASFPTAADSCNAAGLCSTPEPGEDYVERVNRGDAFQGWVDASEVSGLAGTPEYFVEYMGDAPSWPLCDREIPRAPTCMRPRYRITARSQQEGRAEVVLQSSYAGS
jgi:type IV pilus assembly protein PilX